MIASLKLQSKKIKPTDEKIEPQHLSTLTCKIFTHRTLKFSFLSVDAAKDFIPPEIVELLQKSMNTLIQELFRFQENQDKGDGKFEVSFLFLKGKHLLGSFKHMSQSIFHVTLKVSDECDSLSYVRYTLTAICPRY